MVEVRTVDEIDLTEIDLEEFWWCPVDDIIWPKDEGMVCPECGNIGEESSEA